MTEERMKELHYKWFPKITGYIFNRSGDIELSKDIAAEVIYKICMKGLPEEYKVSEDAFIFKCALNLFRNTLKKQKRVVFIPPPPIRLVKYL